MAERTIEGKTLLDVLIFYLKNLSNKTYTFSCANKDILFTPRKENFPHLIGLQYIYPSYKNKTVKAPELIKRILEGKITFDSLYETNSKEYTKHVYSKVFGLIKLIESINSRPISESFGIWDTSFVRKYESNYFDYGTGDNNKYRYWNSFFGLRSNSIEKDKFIPSTLLVFDKRDKNYIISGDCLILNEIKIS